MPNASTARGGSVGGVERLALRVDRQQRAVAAAEDLQLLEAGDGQGVVQPGGAAQRVGVPRVVAAGGEHAGDVGGGGDAHAGAHVAEVARVLEQDHGRRARGRRAPRRDRRVRRSARRDHARSAGQRRELGEDGGLDLARERAQARAQIGRERAASRSSSAASAETTSSSAGAEAQGVLERVKAFEHGERGIAPRAAKARDERSVLHGAMI